MSRLLLCLVLLLAVLHTPLLAADPTVEPGADAARIFAERFPELKILATAATPIAGVYEIVLAERIVYFAPATGHLLVGDLWSPEGRNLSRERQTSLIAERIKNIPLDQAVKLGSGKHTVIEVTDPDCPYCRKGDEFLAKRSDLTRYIFFLPLPMHPEAPQKAGYILAAADPAKAYLEVMSGKFDGQPLPAFTDNGRLAQHRKVAEQLGVRGTPNYWIDGNYLSGANIEAMKELLQ